MRDAFNNALKDPSTQKLFEGLEKIVPVASKPEVREELKKVNIYADLEEKNRELDRIRHEQASASNEGQLIKKPVLHSKELFTLEELPEAVKASANAAALNFMHRRRK
jgi:hypothetical protein